MWRKSSYSMSNGQCVELAPGILVRDSQLRDDLGVNVSPVLQFTPSAWGKFTAGIKEGKGNDL